MVYIEYSTSQSWPLNCVTIPLTCPTRLISQQDAENTSRKPEESVREHANMTKPNPQTHRGIKSRHSQMMAIGGTIGTGLFVGVGEALAVGGPLSVLLGYLIMCLLVYSILTATCEINAYLPISGCSMAYYGTRFVSPSLGCAMGYLYWVAFGVIVGYEITAASVVIHYWPNEIPIAALVTVMLAVVVLLNLLPVRVYGEAEFWFASLKVFMILGLLILSVVLFFGGGPDHKRLGFHYWKDPGAINAYLVQGDSGRFCAFLYVLCYSAFAFNFAPELLVIASAEMQNPRQNLPRTAKMFFYRLLVFYIGSVLAVGVICPSNAPGLTNGSGVAASPFVIAIKSAGIHGLDSVINAVIITSAWSAGNSSLYMSSRSLYSLAVAGGAPSIFTRCNRHGVPVYAVLSSSVFALLAYMNCSAGTSTVFNWLVSLTNTAGFISWTCCCVIFHRFRKACRVQSVTVDSLPYHSRLQPYLAWLATVAFPVLLLCNGFHVFFPGNWSVSSFLTAYVGLVIFIFVYLVHRVLHWSDPWLYSPHQVDLTSGLDEFDGMEEQYNEHEKQKSSNAFQVLWE
ncbi:hypothetical protein ASPZODRAFT_133789 [Penicilliopsis zonata CBS 506.65]|uniref:Amino acid permease/ SLC12A domain-containing protein n=1 Tax=Penicilliopsis zonata CBS 506.65 TaxID=1073090 RepID=A0A1L9SFE5_9EURO|nr:hypothetical protein ASPZODRAFT_133789 [Penicilliopsis zonata CBS 506.65]OJJ45921.1 hypothetical protein ASPZODRAFT_133789 [Penicilliopsis zonata CBS 506.65]